MTLVPVIRDIELVRVDTDSPVAATLTYPISTGLLDHVEAQWDRPRMQLEKILKAEGLVLEHGHWDWSLKARPTAMTDTRFAAVACGGAVQGMMGWAVDRPRSAVYVAFLETAPWNLRTIAPHARYSGVGTALFLEAVTVSGQAGMKGRVVLHALSQSESFYRGRVRMVDCGPDPLYDGMHRFEYNPSGRGDRT